MSLHDVIAIIGLTLFSFLLLLFFFFYFLFLPKCPKDAVLSNRKRPMSFHFEFYFISHWCFHHSISIPRDCPNFDLRSKSTCWMHFYFCLNWKFFFAGIDGKHNLNDIDTYFYWTEYFGTFIFAKSWNFLRPAKKKFQMKHKNSI